jgi:hypothetical protein
VSRALTDEVCAKRFVGGRGREDGVRRREPLDGGIPLTHDYQQAGQRYLLI